MLDIIESVEIAREELVEETSADITVEETTAPVVQRRRMPPVIMSRSLRSRKKLINTATSPTKKSRKRRRFKQNTLIERDIRRIQCSTRLHIPRQAFYRLIREISQDNHPNIRWKPEAIDALHLLSEETFTRLFQRSYRFVTSGNRVAMQLKDFLLAVEEHCNNDQTMFYVPLDERPNVHRNLRFVRSS